MNSRRFPAHTIVLMICALAAFAWFFWMTVIHPPRQPHPTPEKSRVELVPPSAVDKTPRSR